MPPIHRKLRVAVLGAVLLALLAPTAHASDTQLSIMQDDDLVVYRDDATRDKAMGQMKALGADAVRVTVLWSVVAAHIVDKPKNAKEKKAYAANLKNFKKYGAASPRAYPRLNWDRYDRLARACKTIGLICYFDVTGPGPAYAHTKPPSRYAKDAKWWKPKAREFKLFVKAVGNRFSGTYRDENDGRPTVPRVGMWSLWNEPNQGGWLRPQWLNGKAVSPRLYRQLYIAGHQALAATHHDERTDLILVGETAPINVVRRTTTSAMGPKTFINEMLCGPGSNGDGCATDFKTPIIASAWAHHPYTKKLAPTQPDADPEAITLANFNDLGNELDALAATGHVDSGMPLISTEFGYESNPPDPYAPANLEQQAVYGELGDLLTYLNPRVIGHTQFLLRDVRPNKRYRKDSRNYWGTYQSGLYGASGTPKPAATSYAFPFLATAAGADPATGASLVSIFGQIRFRANVLSPEAPDSVQLQFRPLDGSTDFVDLGAPLPVTSANGYFSTTVAIPGPGALRAHWAGPQLPFDALTLVQPVQ